MSEKTEPTVKELRMSEENWPKCPHCKSARFVCRSQSRTGVWHWRCSSCGWYRYPTVPPAPPAPRWIPVTEREPEHSRPVPVAGVAGKSFLVWSPAEKAWRTTDWTQRHCPTHWYDLPEPPPPPAPESMKPQVRWERTGEFRVPRRGEWFEDISDMRPMWAPGDLGDRRWILRRVEVPS